MTRSLRTVPLLLLATLLPTVLLTGCEGGDESTPGPVQSPPPSTAPPPSPGIIAGAVRLEGTPEAGIRVRLDGLRPDSTVTDADGAFRFPGLTPGVWSVALGGSSPNGTWSVGSQTVTVTAGTTARADFDGILRREGRIAGWVGAGGVGLEGVRLRMAGPDSTMIETNAEGRFLIQGLPRGAYRLHLEDLDPERYLFPDLVRETTLATGDSVEVRFEGSVLLRPPPVPQGLRLAATAPDEVVLAWDQVEGADLLRLEEQEGGGAWQRRASFSGADTLRVVPGLRPLATYRWRLEACNDDGCSAPSESVGHDTPPPPPAPPGGLQGLALSPSSVLLGWVHDGDDVAGFPLERRRHGSSEWEGLGEAPADAVSWLDEGLTPGETLLYRIRACGPGGCSDWAGPLELTLQPPPGTPLSLQALPAGPSEIQLVWADAGPGTEVFELERAEGLAGTPAWHAAASVPHPATGWTDVSVTPASSWRYRARACSVAGCSPWTAPVAATTPEEPPPPPPPPPVPPAPSGVSLSEEAGPAVRVQWGAEGSPASSWELQRREGSGAWGGWVTRPAVPGEAQAMALDSAVTAGSTWSYRVRGCASSGCSPWSGEASITLAAAPPPPSGLNLWIEDLHINQVVQPQSGGVPLVAGRDGTLRVFVRASEANTATPRVRIRLYHGASVVLNELLNPPGASVPETIDDTIFGASWNRQIPGHLIVPGLRVLAEVDPDGVVTESDETDNLFPSNGEPLTLDVRTVAPFNIRFVPVHQDSTGLTGTVPDHAMEGAIRMFPFHEVNVQVRAPYTTTAPPLQSGDGNGAWGTVLNEIWALRVAEGGGPYYYGMVRTTYTSGIAGMGFIGFPASVGWDRPGSVSWVTAHELGHNFGRLHAPCGVSGEAGFPHPGGSIGVTGLENGTEIRSPATHRDLMGYCNPVWISDYTFQAVLDFRAAEAMVAGQVLAAQAAGASSLSGRVPTLLLWGRVDAAGQAVLEPPVALETIPALPAPGEGLTLEGLDEGGGILFRHDFAGEETGEQDGSRHFAFALPLASFDREALATLRLHRHGVEVARQPVHLPGALLLPGRPVTSERMADGRTRVRWDAETYPLVIVRDPDTGEILSFARGGEVHLPGAPPQVEVLLPEGTRSRALLLDEMR